MVGRHFLIMPVCRSLGLYGCEGLNNERVTQTEQPIFSVCGVLVALGNCVSVLQLDHGSQ